MLNSRLGYSHLCFVVYFQSKLLPAEAYQGISAEQVVKLEKDEPAYHQRQLNQELIQQALAEVPANDRGFETDGGLDGLVVSHDSDDESDDDDLEAAFNEARRLRLGTEARNQLASANAEGAASLIVRGPDDIMAAVSGTTVVSRDHSTNCPTSCAEACCRQVARHPEAYRENPATVSVLFS